MRYIDTDKQGTRIVIWFQVEKEDHIHADEMGALFPDRVGVVWDEDGEAMIDEDGSPLDFMPAGAAHYLETRTTRQITDAMR